MARTVRDAKLETRTARGAFPGSPITLTFRFTLADGRIARLAIG